MDESFDPVDDPFPSTPESVVDLSLREIEVSAAFESIQNVDINAGALTIAQAINQIESLINEYGTDDWDPTRIIIARSRLLKCRMLSRLDEDEKALKELHSINIDYATSTIDELLEVSADALRFQAELLYFLQRKGEAFSKLRQVIDHYADSAHEGIRHTHAIAQSRLMSWLDAMSTKEDGIAGQQRVIDAADALIAAHGNNDSPPEAWHVILAARYKTDALHVCSKITEEENRDGSQYIFQADALTDHMWGRYREHEDPQVRAQLAYLMNDRLNQWQSPAHVLKGAQEVSTWIHSRYDPELLRPLATTLRLEAWAQRKLGNFSAALVTLDALQTRLADTEDEDLQPSWVNATVEWANVLRQQGRGMEALQRLRATVRLLDIPDESRSEPLRNSISSALDLIADMHSDATPPEPPPLEYLTDSPFAKPREMISLPLTESESAYASAVDDLVRHFASDDSPRIRWRVIASLFYLGVHQSNRMHYNEALATYQRLNGLYPSFTDNESEAMLARSRVNTAFILMDRLNRLPEALEIYDNLNDRFAQVMTREMQDVLARAASSRLDCINLMSRMGMHVDIGPQYEDVTTADRDALEALLNEAIAHENVGNHRAAIASYDRIIIGRESSLHPELRRRVLNALTRKGWNLSKLGQYDSAIAILDESIARFGQDNSLAMEQDISFALAQKATALDALGRHIDEIAVYDQIIGRWSESTVLSLLNRVSTAMWCKAYTLGELGRLYEAEHVYVQTAKDFLEAPAVDLKLDGAKACINLGYLLRNQGRTADATYWFQCVCNVCRDIDDEDIQNQVIRARWGLAQIYVDTGYTQQAITEYHELLSIPDHYLGQKRRASIISRLNEIMPTAKPAGLKGLWNRLKG